MRRTLFRVTVGSMVAVLAAALAGSALAQHGHNYGPRTAFRAGGLGPGGLLAGGGMMFGGPGAFGSAGSDKARLPDRLAMFLEPFLGLHFASS
jgi:hypothetical protein